MCIRDRLYIHCHAELERLLTPQLDFFCKGMSYKVVFQTFDPGKAEIIYDDRSLTIETIPLRHRIPTCGFLFSEKQTPAHIRRDMINFYEIPVYELNRIKNGADYTLPVSYTHLDVYKRQELVHEGRIEHFNVSKGYGFVKDLKNAEKYFFHISGLIDNIKMCIRDRH